MATKFSSKTSKSFNIWRKMFQYITCNFVIQNVIKYKYNFRVEGLENFDKNKKYIVASNHITGFDPFIIVAALHLTIAFMAKKQLFETFWSMVLMDWCGAFAVDREKVDVSTIKTALSIQKTDWNLGIFPQGTRCNNGKLENPAKGFVAIARKINADILPVGIAVKDNPESKKKDFVIRVGQPVKCSDNTEETVTKWADAVGALAGLQYVPGK